MKQKYLFTELCVTAFRVNAISAHFWASSGNRGLCAQVCRLPFGVMDNSRYNLSLKDLSLIDYVNELKSIGVKALKIEGRMKGADYVYTAVSQFKNVLSSKKYDKNILEKSFSRSGFTQGYYLSKIDDDMFGIRRELDKSQSNENKKDFIADTVKTKIPVKMKFSISKDKTELLIKDGLGNMFISYGDKAQTAVSKSLTNQNVVISFSKLNDTPFSLENIEGFVGDNLYLSVSSLNELRRNAVENLIKIRQERKRYTINIPKLTLSPLTEKLKDNINFTASFISAGQISERIIKLVEYAAIDVFEIDKIDNAVLSKYHKKFIAELPRIYFGDEKQIIDRLIDLKRIGITKVKCHSIGRMKLAKDLEYEVIAGFGLNISNSVSAQFLSQYNPFYITLSPDLSASQINDIKTYDKKAISGYGHFPLMICRACPVKHEIGCQKCKKNNVANITDRKGKKFAVMCSHNVSQIFNSVPLYIADKLDSFKDISYCELFFATESEDTCYEVILRYLQKKDADNEFTRGTYFRKLK